ncbi:MAG: metal-dependent transcriptional regulator [Candidatus Brockarchaeota archaeon]|nr:metal-dependent transcriptional regulator [Candidatus Brockarchaeota archaeon]
MKIPLQEVTDAMEEYLEAIYKLEEKSGAARTSEIVKDVKVVPGTVTNTVERLEKEGYVTHAPYKGVKLTEKGRKVALQVVRRHRLSERLLTDILHVGWDKSHDAACKLEHGITEEVLKPLEKALRHPKTCPHGNPIPTEFGGVVEEKSRPLSKLNKKERGEIAKITEERSDLLRYLNGLGLVPGASVEVVEKAPFDGPVTLKVGEASVAISVAIASAIQVKRAK